MIQWCYNAKTGEIFSYKQCGELTDFPRGVFLAYGDYLTTGIKDRETAEKQAQEWGCCDKCRSSCPTDETGNCRFCGSKIIFHKA